MSEDDPSVPTAYVLPEQHPRIEPPSSRVPIPDTTDGELSRIEYTSLDIDETILAAMEHRKVLGWRYAEGPAWESHLFRLQIAEASLVGKADPVSLVRARWVAHLLKK